MHKQTLVDTIIVFAAGKGTRMHPITTQIPKSLIKIKDKPILQWVLDFTKNYNFKRIIINTHHLAEQIHEFIKCYQLSNPDFPEIIISHEEMLLETGGGLKKIINYTDCELIFSINSDTIITDQAAFHKLIDSWDNKLMDINMLVQPIANTIGYRGKGNFMRDINGKVFRAKNLALLPYMYSGLQLIAKKITDSFPKKVFSLSEFYINEPYRSRIYSQISQGKWYHATSPEDIKAIETSIL